MWQAPIQKIPTLLTMFGWVSEPNPTLRSLKSGRRPNGQTNGFVEAESPSVQISHKYDQDFFLIFYLSGKSWSPFSSDFPQKQLGGGVSTFLSNNEAVSCVYFFTPGKVWILPPSPFFDLIKPAKQKHIRQNLWDWAIYIRPQVATFHRQPGKASVFPWQQEMMWGLFTRLCDDAENGACDMEQLRKAALVTGVA